MNTIIETQPVDPFTPECPSWCRVTPHHCYTDIDGSRPDRRTRHHMTYAAEAELRRGSRGWSVIVSSTEHVDRHGQITEEPIGIHLTYDHWNGIKSPERARTLAAALLEAADALEAAQS